MQLRALFLAALTASACASQRPAAPSDAPELSAPAEVVADAEYALAVANAVARGAWDDWVPGSVPFVIVYPSEQWAFRAAGPLPGYDPRAFASRLGPVYRAPSWTRYDGAQVSFEPRFFAQADRYDGRLTFTIAAPSLAPFPVSDWAMVFAHEFFHTFQMADSRWSADSPLLAPGYRHRLAELYQTDSVFRALVTRELDLYAARLQSGNPPACDGLEGIARVRKQRADLLTALDPQLPKAESALERLEGTARYVEEQTYEQEEIAWLFRSREPGWTPPPAEKSLKRRLSATAGEYYYATGYALSCILDTCHPLWKKSLSGMDLLELIRVGARKEAGQTFEPQKPSCTDDRVFAETGKPGASVDGGFVECDPKLPPSPEYWDESAGERERWKRR